VGQDTVRAIEKGLAEATWYTSPVPNHGTAFKTDWINNALYEIASFMVMRESTV